MAADSSPAYDTVEALCQHHEIDAFVTTEQVEYAQLLDVYRERSSRGYGDRVLVAVSALEVRGYLASIDLTLTAPADVAGLYFFVSTVAVRDSYLGSSIFTALAKVALQTVEPIEASRGLLYQGILARPGAHRALQNALRSLAFRPVPGTDYWARRLRS